ncbi:MAG: CRTAC1 family protein [Planctomycetia bacterium]|nr:CRTAC1 family protein [Planctomycetia bacterium]
MNGGRPRFRTAPAALAAAGLALLVACGGEPGTGSTTPPAAAAAGDTTGLLRDATARSGIDFVHHLGDGKLDNLVEAVGAGGCVLDADGDGRLDVYLVDQGWHADVSTGPRPDTATGSRLYRNVGDGRFEDVTAKAGVGDPGYAFGAIAGDVDGDGRTDLYVLCHGPNRLYRNLGGGRFEDATAKAGVGDPRSSVAGAFLDADHDGDLDLYVGNYVTFDVEYKLHYAPDGFSGPLAFAPQPDAFYRNRGDGTFEDATAASGIDRVAPGRAMGVVVFDADADGHPDLYVANDASANFLFLNDGHGVFREVGTSSGTAFGFHGEATSSMAGTVGDLDGDGRPDLLVTDGSFGSLYRNLGAGKFQDRVRASGFAQHASAWAHWGAVLADFDADGALDAFAAAADLHYATGRPDLLLRNRGDGTFEDLAERGGPYFRRETVSRAVLTLDADDDGRLDVLVTRIGASPVFLRNAGVPGHHGVTLALVGAPPAREALGARVVVEAGGRRTERVHQLATGYLGQHDPRVHVGLGTATKVDRVEVTWPDGTVTTRTNLDVDRVHRLEQRGPASAEPVRREALR